ncbi:MAG: SH3 domain-containing protein [Treponema sp.]|nr:SH3 domain-containing protein [Treponema sp.]
MPALETTIIVIVSVAVGVLIIILIREVICWYFKLNTIVDLLIEQNLLLKKIAGVDQAENKEHVFLTIYKDVPLKAGASSDTETVAEMKEGDVVEYISETKDKWTRVKTSDGRIGYCLPKYLVVENPS